MSSKSAFFDYFYNAQKQLGTQLELEMLNLKALGQDVSLYGVEFDTPIFDKVRGTIILGARSRKLTHEELEAIKKKSH